MKAASDILARATACVATAVIAAAPGVGAGNERADLEAVAKRRIYFGHMSVGSNVMEGVRMLAEEEKVPLRVLFGAPPLPASGGAFMHGAVPENGDPLRKLESFARNLGPRTDVDPEIALVKFCYVDFDARTDAAALFARYRAAIAEQKARHPATTFVHVTAPLTKVVLEGGARAFAKRILGRVPREVLENAQREEYNDLLRKAYRGEPVFDLAAIESTHPDGRRESVELEGRAVPALVPAYTDDGGHLNREGRLRAARALVGVLARVPPRGAVVPASAR